MYSVGKLDPLRSDELTTENTEDTEAELFHFRVFRVFRGQIRLKSPSVYSVCSVGISGQLIPSSSHPLSIG